jgi:hypothetical protein
MEIISDATLGVQVPFQIPGFDGCATAEEPPTFGLADDLILVPMIRRAGSTQERNPRSSAHAAGHDPGSMPSLECSRVGESA